MRRTERRPEAGVIQDYFQLEADQIPIPPAPAYMESTAKSGLIRKVARRVVLASLVSGVMVLLAATAGRPTSLAHSIDTAFARYEVNEKITGFFIAAGNLYQENFTGDEK